MLTMKRVGLPMVTALTLTALLAGCSGGDDAKKAEVTPSPTSTATAVTDEALGQALDVLVFSDAKHASTDGGVCLAEAVKSAGISQEGQAYIVEIASDDLGAVVEGLSEVNSKDADLLVSTQLRKKFDACVDAEVLSEAGSEKSDEKDGDKKSDEKKKSDDKTYESPKNPPEKQEEGKPNLTPKYDVDEDVKITASSQLVDGVISMFSSYAQNDEQKKVYAASGECLAGVIFDAGFSQASLKFIAGGAPIGVGSVSDYLPNEDDKAIWETPDFKMSLVDCTTNADTSDEA